MISKIPPKDPPFFGEVFKEDVHGPSFRSPVSGVLVEFEAAIFGVERSLKEMTEGKQQGEYIGWLVRSDAKRVLNI